METSTLEQSVHDKIEEAEALRSKIDYDRALAVIEETITMLKTSPESEEFVAMHAQTLLKRAEIYKMTGRWKDAMADIEKALQLPSGEKSKGEMIKIHVTKGEFLSFFGEYAESIKSFEAALEIGKQRNIAEELALCYLHLGTVKARMGDHQTGKELIEQCLDMVKELKETRETKSLKASALSQAGLQCFRKGKFDEAVSQYEKAINMLEEREDSLEKAEAYRYIGVIHSIKSNYREALSYHQKALQIVSHAHYVFGMAKVYNSIGQLCLDVQKLDEALFFMGKAETICRELGADAEAATIYGKLGNIFMQKEDYENAVTYHLKDLEMCKRFQNNRALAYTYRNLGLSYLHSDQTEKAISYLKEGLERFREFQDTVNVGRIHIDLCNAYLAGENVDEAEKAGQQALSSLEKYPQSPDTAYAKTLCGVIARKKKDFDCAYKYFTESMEILGWKEPSTRLIETHHELGILYLEMNDLKKALVNFKIALRTARDMGLKKQVEKNLKVVEKIDEMEIVNIILEEL